ncbi:hypothetical protein DNTS_012398 [Danionella cerebrum]|uniref:Uncharacterized protein n=1 Tax=Danionella cerebrum TaxID=2873325 RepID=A0A553N0Q2_9TELE|nr:hypothetical protein DNTS_012398 [Danionella translucida]
MSVICANSWGWVLDARAKIDEDVKRCFCLKDGFKETKYFKCGFKNEFFDILKPRIQLDVDSKKDDFGKESKMESTGVDLQRRKKRKRKHRDLNIGEVEANIYHDKIRSVVIHGSQALLDAGRQCGFFIEESIISQKPSSSPIPPECHLAALSDLAKELPLSHESAHYTFYYL